MRALYKENARLTKELESTRAVRDRVHSLLEKVNNRFGDFLSKVKSTSTTNRELHDVADSEKLFTLHLCEKIRAHGKATK